MFLYSSYKRLYSLEQNLPKDFSNKYDIISIPVSVHSLAAPFGSLLAGSLIDQRGRRFGCMVAVVPLACGWILIAGAHAHWLLLAGRLVAGFGVGLTAPPAQILLAECAEPEYRGFLVGVPMVAYASGILVTYSLGAFLTWRAVAWCCAVVPLAAVAVALFVPESPTWLARKGHMERARAALLWLRCDERMADEELTTIHERFARERKEATLVAAAGGQSLWQLVTRSEMLKPMCIIFGFNMLVLLAGTYLVVFYVIDIIRDLDVGVNSMHAAIYTASVRLVASLICSVLVHRMQRRTMLIGASALAAVSCLGLVAFNWWRSGLLQKTPLDTYVSAALLLVYIATSMTFMMFPGIMVSELLPARVRGQVSGVIFCSMHAVFFGTAKVFPYFAQAVKMNGVFVLFGMSSALMAMWIFALLPETRGRTLGQIEDYFVVGRWLWMRRPAEVRMVEGKGEGGASRA